jgi:hypothetical protein
MFQNQAGSEAKMDSNVTKQEQKETSMSPSKSLLPTVHRSGTSFCRKQISEHRDRKYIQLSPHWLQVKEFQQPTGKQRVDGL